MSSTVNLATLVTDDGMRRDRWGRALLVPPGGGQPVAHTRVTTVAKATDDGGGLAPWKATMACVGTMLRPGLRARWEALTAAHNGRPWYAGPEAKKACKALVEECADAGGAADRRQQGDALHALTAQLDRGGGPSMRGLSPQTEADLTAYVNTLADVGITLDASMVERHVVLDGHTVSGSFDRLVTMAGRPLPLIADLKTGAELSYSWPAFATQLAAYSRASALYDQGAAPDGSEDVRSPMPEVDQEVGLIIWLPAGEARCEVHLVDLVAGWEGFELALWVRRWRSAKPHLGPAPPAPAPASLVAGIEHVEPFETAHEAEVRQAAPTPEAHERPLEAPRGVEDVAALRRWLQGRIDVLGRTDATRDDLVRSWPASAPFLSQSDAHSGAQLAAIEHVLDDVEARHSVPFGPSRPGNEHVTDADAIARLLHVFPGSTATTKEQP